MARGAPDDAALRQRIGRTARRESLRRILAGHQEAFAPVDSSDSMRAQLLRLDHALRAWAVTHRIAWLDQPIFLLSAAGLFGGVWVFIALILALFRRFLWRDFGRLVLVLIVTTVVTDYVLKPAIHRARPFHWTPDILVIGRHSDTSSFPSGHTATAVAGAFVFTRVLPAGRVVWWLLAAAIAELLVVLCVPLPLHVIAGGHGRPSCELRCWRITLGGESS